MKLYDISMTVDEYIPVYNNKEEIRPKITVISDFTTGSSYSSNISMNMHTGTHIDAPMHMIEGGAAFETIDINKLVTDCFVYDFTNVQDRITAEDLKTKDIKPEAFILLKTRNSFVEGFDENFVFVDESGARYLKSLQITGVGIDSLGIERSQPGHETHKTLMGHGIIILEGLRLADIAEGAYKMAALPIKLRGTEASPARVVLIEE